MSAGYISVTDTAKMLRKALKSSFPGVKFSVRSSSYSGGASIDIRWTDGPTEKQVDEVARLYQGATFDGMRDLKEHHSTLLADEAGDVVEVRFGADFVFCNRKVSDAGMAFAEAVAEARPLRGAGQCECCQLHFADGAGMVVDRSAGGWAGVCSTACAARYTVRDLDLRDVEGVR